MRTQVEDEDDEHARVLYEIQSLIVHILNLPPLPLPFSEQYSHVADSSTLRNLCTTLLSSQVSPAAFASLFLGISLALILFGTLAFVIGLVLLPWVFALVFAFYTASVVSALSRLGRTVLCSAPVIKDIPCDCSDLLKS
ncbi:hypothetical protein K1719_008038 [Acacia pycnantha]|nr:hypothetical protein K1719_008038 [Acacia pycnantha]